MAKLGFVFIFTYSTYLAKCFFFPSSLVTSSYGAEGAGGKIPPNSWLVFDVELIDVR